MNTIWWFSKDDYPKADTTKVLVPYSARMKKLLKNSKKFYKPKLRPSGHNISDRFGEDKGGAIPPNYLLDAVNALEIANTESRSKYLTRCKIAGAKPNPARFPRKIPEFFIDYLTDKGDTVLDIFAGSNITGKVAEDKQRNWIAVEVERKYVAGSALRFLDSDNETEIKQIYNELMQEGTVNYSLVKNEQKIDSNGQ